MFRLELLTVKADLFASRSIPAASQPWNSFSFELKVTP
jgi:hypothetical protein